MRIRQRNKLLLFVIITIGSLLVLISFINYLFSPSYKAKKVVEAFYTYEQSGDFADSWELLHPLMKEKWSKTQFMTDRSPCFYWPFWYRNIPI